MENEELGSLQDMQAFASPIFPLLLKTILVGGEVYIWDLKAQDCLHRFFDDGCIRGTAIDVSRNNRYLATGSDSGVVNIYRCVLHLFSCFACVEYL